jgi:hypothetical protein
MAPHSTSRLWPERRMNKKIAAFAGTCRLKSKALCTSKPVQPTSADGWRAPRQLWFQWPRPFSPERYKTLPNQTTQLKPTIPPFGLTKAARLRRPVRQIKDGDDPEKDGGSPLQNEEPAPSGQLPHNELLTPGCYGKTPSISTMSESPSARAAKTERLSEDQETRRAMIVRRWPKSVTWRRSPP